MAMFLENPLVRPLSTIGLIREHVRPVMNENTQHNYQNGQFVTKMLF